MKSHASFGRQDFMGSISIFHLWLPFLLPSHETGSSSDSSLLRRSMKGQELFSLLFETESTLELWTSFCHSHSFLPL